VNATARKSKRGGGRNTGKKLANNTSGLAGIWFQQRYGIGENPTLHTYVCSAYTVGKGAGKKAKRTAFSIRTNGVRGAMHRAIAVRVACGLPAPTLDEMEQALKNFREQLQES
jgi:hypothetical protein